VNVASNEYFKAVDTSVFGENIEIVNMIFKEKKVEFVPLFLFFHFVAIRVFH
jgi:hypothetical protein